MKQWRFSVIPMTNPLSLIILISCALGAFPPSVRRQRQPPQINKIISVQTTCDASVFNVSIGLEQPFKGILFAKDFSQECSAYGGMQESVSINLPTSGCGVRLTSKDNDMYYNVIVVVQQDRHLRQITDQERLVQCHVDRSEFVVRSKPMEEVLLADRKDHRSGRMKDEGWSTTERQQPDEERAQRLNEALKAARAWMEIVPLHETDKKHDGSLQVGEDALLMVKSTLPVGIGWKVIDCNAHDGLGDSSQKLLDEFGCPVDELLMPEPLKGPAKPIALMRHQEAVAKFAAFKFPDRDRLHLACGLQLCRGKCQKIDCASQNDTRAGKRLHVGDDGEILDRLEVFNSVEVLAPGIELDNIDRQQAERNDVDPFRATFGYIPGDRTFCVSPDKMALTFCVLGLIFLSAVIVAAFALYKARRTGVPMPYYTRSLFSSSSGSGSAYGSKLLLQDSPCMGQSSSGRGYGRIL